MLVQTDVNTFLLLTSAFKSNHTITGVVRIKLRLIPPFGKRRLNARIVCGIFIYHRAKGIPLSKAEI